ncbi:MAG TPA: hypothetical protein VF273_08715 [Pelobium sp.]
MKFIILLLIGLLNLLKAHSQIKNNGFELSKDSLGNIKSWNFKNYSKYIVELDSNIKFSGSKSLHIKGTTDKKEDPFISFFQDIRLLAQSTKKLKISCYIKTSDVSGSSQIWCQVWDQNRKFTGVYNLEMQDITITGNTEWKLYQVIIPVNIDTYSLNLGGFLSGSGSV